MNRKALWIIAVLFVLGTVIFIACGGGGGPAGGGDGSASYTVGGTVSGLSGSGLALQNNGGDDLAISTNATFTFTTKIADRAAYAVTVRTQPTNPNQNCTVNSGTGTMSGANVSGVTVACSTLSSAKAITSFLFTSPAVTGSIDESAKTISVFVPFGTGLGSLTPTIVITGASVSPVSGVARDFSSPVIYTVTAANGSTAMYTVTVTPCGPNTTFSGGACVCNANYYDCNGNMADGCEFFGDLMTDLNNCGACGHVCSCGPPSQGALPCAPTCTFGICGCSSCGASCFCAIN